MLLGDALSNQPLEVLEGKKVIEVHLRGVSKALVAYRLQAEVAPDAVVFAVGDDRTDEKLFRALPPSSITVAVGRQTSCARFHVHDYRAVRRLLQEFLTVDDRPPVPLAESPPSPSPVPR
jgi:trehalose 6-phosphate synthase/phosphatase